MRQVGQWCHKSYVTIQLEERLLFNLKFEPKGTHRKQQYLAQLLYRKISCFARFLFLLSWGKYWKLPAFLLFIHLPPAAYVQWWVLRIYYLQTTSKNSYVIYIFVLWWYSFHSFLKFEIYNNAGWEIAWATNR